MIDTLEYGIIWAVNTLDTAWKKRVYDHLLAHRHELPGLEQITLQEVGRRIDKLHDSGHLDTCILSPEEVNRDLVIGYHVTEHGHDAAKRKRKSLLQKHVLQPERRGEENLDRSMNRSVLITLMCDEFQIDDVTRKSVLEECETQDLMTSLKHYYGEKNVDPAASANPLPYSPLRSH